jgi:choline dehydrogenase-like flavoprotein
MQNSLSLYKYKSMLGASKGLARLRSVFSPKIFHPDILAEIYFHLLGLNLRSRIYNILIILEQKRGSNRVSYNDGRINVDWCISEEELRIYNGILKRLASMLRSVSDELNILDNLTEDWLWSAAHHSGTVPLGSSPHGLIDKDLKLNSYDNVFVCDGSVIQEHSYANTGLTIGQLALRLADRVSSIA